MAILFRNKKIAFYEINLWSFLAKAAKDFKMFEITPFFMCLLGVKMHKKKCVFFYKTKN